MFRRIRAGCRTNRASERVRGRLLARGESRSFPALAGSAVPRHPHPAVLFPSWSTTPAVGNSELREAGRAPQILRISAHVSISRILRCVCPTCPAMQSTTQYQTQPTSVIYQTQIAAIFHARWQTRTSQHPPALPARTLGGRVGTRPSPPAFRAGGRKAPGKPASAHLGPATQVASQAGGLCSAHTGLENCDNRL